MVHRARLLPRLALVAVIMAITLGVTGLVVSLALLGTADVARVDRDGATRTTERGPTDAELPAAWPEALAPPVGARIVTSVASDTGTPDEQLVLVVEATGGGVAVADALRAQLAAAGLTVTADSLGAEGTGSLIAAGAGWEAAVAVSPNPARPEVTTGSWVLRRGPR